MLSCFCCLIFSFPFQARDSKFKPVHHTRKCDAEYGVSFLSSSDQTGIPVSRMCEACRLRWRLCQGPYQTPRFTTSFLKAMFGVWSVYLLSHHWNSRPSICSQIIITHRFYLALVSTLEQTRCVFSSVHVGLLLCVHNTPNSDLAYRIFNMRKRSSCICAYVIFFGDCSQSDSSEKQQQKMP